MAESKKRGLVATAAIIALLVAVIGIGIADYYIASNRVVTETSISTTTLPGMSITETATTTSSVTSVSVSDQVVVSDETTTEFSTTIATPTTTITIFQTSGNISQITTAEAVLYGGKTATASSNATASFLIGFYNPNSTTFISSIVLESSSFTPIIAWDNSSRASSPANLETFSSMHLGDTLSSKLTSVFTFYPATSSAVSIQAGATYQYVVFFASGVSVAGSLTAQ